MTTNFDEDEEQSLASSSAVPLDERILDAVARHAKKDEAGSRIVRPALLVSELGLSVEDATRELCGLLSAVGGGEGGASFTFEKVDVPQMMTEGEMKDVMGLTAASAMTTMVFSFPEDFGARARRHRRRADLKEKLRALSVGLVKAIKVFTAFGLIISLTVLIIAAICLLVAAVIALARGGGHGGGHRNHPLMHRLRFLFFELRQILWLYAICGSVVDGNRDPFMREIAGDMALAMSLCCGNPVHPFFWFRIGGMRRRWARVRRTRGWGGNSAWAGWHEGENVDGITMVRRGTWGNDGSSSSQRGSASFDPSGEHQQRGLLSIAVEFLFGPDDGSPASGELEKWKFRACVIMALSAISQNGITLHDLLPYVDDPPASADDSSAVRETLRIVAYFNGKPADAGGRDRRAGMDAAFCFPEIVAEMDFQKLLMQGGSEFAPPAFGGGSESSGLSSMLYKESGGRDFGSSHEPSGDVPEYLYERPAFLTELSREQFGQCAILGLLNLVGMVWVRSEVMPGGLLELRSAAASILMLKLMGALRFYAVLFFALPLCRLAILAARNYRAEKRNGRRRNFVRTDL